MAKTRPLIISCDLGGRNLSRIWLGDYFAPHGGNCHLVVFSHRWVSLECPTELGSITGQGTSSHIPELRPDAAK